MWRGRRRYTEAASIFGGHTPQPMQGHGLTGRSPMVSPSTPLCAKYGGAKGLPVSTARAPRDIRPTLSLNRLSPDARAWKGLLRVKAVLRSACDGLCGEHVLLDTFTVRRF